MNRLTARLGGIFLSSIIMTMETNDLDAFVEQAMSALPRILRDKIINLAIVIEDRPADDDADGILGLYEGLPIVEREGDSTGLLPDIITLYRIPIEREARDSGLPVAQVVHETVWHELSHYFGFDEEEAERKEKKWAKNLK